MSSLLIFFSFGRRRPSGGLPHGVLLKTENMGIKETIGDKNKDAEQQICVHLRLSAVRYFKTWVALQYRRGYSLAPFPLLLYIVI